MMKDLTGRTFGRLTALSHEDTTPRGEARWRCQCVCGNQVVVRGHNLTAPNRSTRSCGCLRHESRPIHGHTAGGQKPGKEYRAWVAMKQRCYNHAYPGYPKRGGMGVTVCDRWMRSYLAFLEDVGPSPSPLHLLWLTKGTVYEPGATAWLTKSELAHNRRITRILKEAA
jgi:hypothetical protein